MYTIDEENMEELNDEYYSNNRGLIVKIIIIILCIIVLIWLFKALKAKRNVVIDESVHVANVEKVRLIAEDYFFIKNNKSDENTKVVNLNTLKNSGLKEDIIDANNKVCSNSSSQVSLIPQTDNYKMIIKLVCSTNDKEEEFLYHNKTLACLDCNGKTNMTGKEEKEIKEEVKIENEGNKNDDYVVPVSNDEYSEYSCVNWSSWTKKRANESFLIERSKTLVQGVKYENSKVIYGDWSEYTTTPIEANENVEVETKIVRENVWSEPKTSLILPENEANIKIIRTEQVKEDNFTCDNGYILNNACYSNDTVIGNLTFKEYNSGKYNIKNNRCERVMTLKNDEGKYVLTYVNCEYNEIISEDITKNDSYNVYTYQELIETDVTYYRFRTKTVVNDGSGAIYTKDKYDEDHLPDGYVKVPGTEETYYSYKIATCEK